ncbi:hypothetical protein PV375_07000 [Gulosibacter sp. GYB002]|uniref:hypothetical protein n=1 Tax=Gulosibacter sp. GYB002 TaxID=2994391 RepID=UPI002F96A5F5
MHLQAAHHSNASDQPKWSWLSRSDRVEDFGIVNISVGKIGSGTMAGITRFFSSFRQSADKSLQLSCD